MRINAVVTKPVRCRATDPITNKNMQAIALWCGGSIQHPLFEELYGCEIEVLTKDGYKYARLGDRIVLTPDGFHIITPIEFDKNYSIVEGVSDTWDVGTVGE